MKQFALLAALVALAACATAPARDIANGPTAALGEVANLEGVTVRPLELVEDSRCPTLVRCVWAGTVRIRAEISGAGTRDLTLGEPAAISSGMVTLVDVRPGKRTPEAIPAREYQFTFRFERR